MVNKCSIIITVGDDVSHGFSFAYNIKTKGMRGLSQIRERRSDMEKNYLTYPLKNMNITQTYSGRTSHLTHNTGTPKDYPIDEAGANTGREYMYCPCDEMTVRRIYGVGSSGTNTIWLQSNQKVYFADGTSDYFTLMVTHPNDDDLRKLSTGQTFKRGEKICREGTDGNATGNHFHISAGKGKIKGNGWVQNTNGKWVLSVLTSAQKPENLFYVDRKFTSVIKNGGLSFKNLPEENNAEEKTGKYVVTADVLNVRTGPGTNYDFVRFNKMTKSAQEQIVKLYGRKKDGYVKGIIFTASKIQNGWAKTPSGWVSLKYCRKITDAA